MHELIDNKTLFEQLSSLLLGEGSLAEIKSREKFVEQGTYPIELVTCRMGDSRELVLFCKYLAGGGPNNHGHRGGVAYEAKVYSEIISKISLPAIKYFGSREISEKNELIIVLEFIGKNLRFAYSKEKDVLQKAATWIGAFHGLFEENHPDFIKKYDKDYYNHWLNWFKELAKPFYHEFPVIQELIRHFEENMEMLLSVSHTLIHGEYYPRNVLIKNGIIYPVDWESTAIAPGEMDLASLIELWDKVSVDGAKESYLKARWPNGNYSRADFEQRLAICRIYLFFRWCPFRLEKSAWIRNERIYGYMRQLCFEAKQCFGEKNLIEK